MGVYVAWGRETWIQWKWMQHSLFYRMDESIGLMDPSTPTFCFDIIIRQPEMFGQNEILVFSMPVFSFRINLYFSTPDYASLHTEMNATANVKS